MSDTPIQFPGASESKESNLIILHPPCKVAYTLNNAQPVLCTIIGDEPMFYMDAEEEISEFDDELFDFEDIAVLEREVSALKQEIEELERFSGMFDDLESKKFEAFAENITEITTSDFDRECAYTIDELLAIMTQSRLAQAYIECTKEYNVDILLTDQVETAFYDRKSGTILISNNLEFSSAILMLGRELRRHWQHRQGGLIHPLQFNPDNAVVFNRIQIADLSTSMVRIAWELQLCDYKDAWEALEQSSMADLAHAFAREAFMDFRTINNGEAATATFEAWFLSDRCRSYDKDLIQQMLADYQGNIFDIDQVLNGLGAEIIAALGTMPFGKNYLSRHAGTILSDPIFTDVRDRSNANFLWFIKFERTFRETEHELQLRETSQGWHDHDGPSSKNWSTQNGASGQIIQFDAYTKDTHTGCEQQPGDGKGADILYIKNFATSE